MLTDLHNRAFAELELARHNDTEDSLPVSIIMGDVNGLKLANDTFGRLAGDNMLRAIARIIKGACRPSDIVARWGGDEFVIILPETDLETTETICLKIQSACRMSNCTPLQLSISLGAATKVTPCTRLATVISYAEDRMYRNKMVEQQGARGSLVACLQQTLVEKSYETEEHAERLRSLALCLGKVSGFSSSQLDDISLLAKLHDIGKITISDEILLKPGPLSEDEWEIMKRHPETGYRIAQSTPELAPISFSILAHHERWDGTGYPLGLKGEEIPFLARVIAVVDAYDVMTHGRPYKSAISEDDALMELQMHAGSQFDPEIVQNFLRVVCMNAEDADTW